MHKVLKLGPIGKGYVQEIKTKNGTRFVARWNAYVQSDDGERIRVTCGPHELGPKVPHGPGLKSIKDARKEWEKVYWTVFSQHHPAAALKSSKSGHTASATTSVKDFITSEFEARRRAGWEENSRLNWEYGKVVIPPKLASDLEGWRKYGDTNGSDLETFIFPTRNGTCLIPTNWIEDVLKPAGIAAGIPDVSPHWFRRGHATVQHHGGVHDKPIQGQLRHANPELTRNVYMQQVDPETWKAVVDLEMLVSKNGDETQSA